MLKPRALIGPVMLLACLLAWMGCQGPRQSLDLAGRFSETGRGPLLGPSGELGEPRAAAFLTGQWEWSREQSERNVVLGVAALRRLPKERSHDGRSWGGPRLSGDCRRRGETDDVSIGPPPLHRLLERAAEDGVVSLDRPG